MNQPRYHVGVPLAIRVVITVLVLCLATGNASAQAPDPKRAFTEALGRFSAALDGRYGDDGTRLAASLSAMEGALARWDAAIRQVEASMAAEIQKAAAPDAVRIRVAMALTFAERGRVEDALAQITAALTLSPRDVDAHTVLGLIHTQLTGNLVAAGSALRTAVAADPAAPLQRYLLAKHLADQGALEEAAAVAQPLRADARNPDAPDRAPFVRINLLPEVAGIEPFYPHTRYMPAFALLARGDFAGALAALRVAIAGDPLSTPPPGTASALAQAGAALRDGDVTLALSALDGVRQAAPDWSDGYRLRGVALAAAERIPEAVTAFREALRLTPNDERGALGLADALLQEDRFDDASTVLSTAITAVPQSSRLRHAHARVLQRQGLYPEALAAFDASLALQPALPLLGMNSVYDTVATLRRARQEFPEATTAYSRRAGLIPNSAAAHRDLGDIYFRQDLDELAWTEFAMAEALAPRDVDTQAALAQLHLRAGRLPDAIASARRAIQLSPAHVQAHYVLGTALVRTDQTAEGTRALDTFARLQAEDAQTRKVQLELSAWRREAQVAAGRGDHAAAVTLLGRILEQDAKSALVHVELGEALLKAGRAREAVDRLQAAAGLGASFDVYRQLAEAYEALGETDLSLRARGVYDRIVRENLRRAGNQ